MPIYEYQCQSCKHKLEKLQRLSDPALTDCPECSKPELRRLMSAAGFRLKGAGWYETDFKKDNQRNLAEPVTAKSDGDGVAKAEKSNGDGGAKTDAPAKSDGAGKTASADTPATTKSKSSGSSASDTA